MNPVAVTLAVFAIVYLGMLLGRLPQLQLDRVGVALLGAIALVALGVLSIEEAARAVDLATIALLFALMVLSAQLRLGGFYGRVAEAVTRLGADPSKLLLAVVLLAGALAAVFTNDIVCLAVAPVLIDACRRRGLDPVPFLLALACAANVGSAATLIGNPQNILIGETLGLSFVGYLADAGVPAAAGLLATWAVIAAQQRGRWTVAPEQSRAVTVVAGAPKEDDDPMPAPDRWQTTKGLLVTAALLIAFLATDARRDLVALAGAGVLLCSRRLHSRRMLGLVDWQLLVLFGGLFVVNHALEATGVTARAVAGLGDLGIDSGDPGWLFALTIVLSNTVSNVPAVMLLAPLVASVPEGYPLAGPLLALTSTLAGNLLIVGSIANAGPHRLGTESGGDRRRRARRGGRRGGRVPVERQGRRVIRRRSVDIEFFRIVSTQGAHRPVCVDIGPTRDGRKRLASGTAPTVEVEQSGRSRTAHPGLNQLCSQPFSLHPCLGYGNVDGFNLSAQRLDPRPRVGSASVCVGIFRRAPLSGRVFGAAADRRAPDHHGVDRPRSGDRGGPGITLVSEAICTAPALGPATNLPLAEQASSAEARQVRAIR